MATSYFGWPEVFHWSMSNPEMDFFCRWLARKPTHGTKQETEGEAPIGSTWIELYGYIVTWCLAKDDHFAYYANSSGDGQMNCRRLHDICMTSSWLWANLCCYPCKHESEILSRCFKCPPCLCRIPSKSKRCKSVEAMLTNFAGWRYIDLQSFFSPAVTIVEYQESLGQPQSLSYLPGLLECDSVIRSSEVLKDWHLIQCSQTVSAANFSIPKLTLQGTPPKKMQRSSGVS